MIAQPLLCADWNGGVVIRSLRGHIYKPRFVVFEIVPAIKSEHHLVELITLVGTLPHFGFTRGATKRRTQVPPCHVRYCMLKVVAKHIRESILLAHSHAGGERVSQKTDSPLAVLLWTNLCIAKAESVHVPFNRVIVVPQLSASAGRIRATISTGCAQRNRSFALNVKSGRGPT